MDKKGKRGNEKGKKDEIKKTELRKERMCQKDEKKRERKIEMAQGESDRVKGRSRVGNDLKRIVTPTCPLHEQKC